MTTVADQATKDRQLLDRMFRPRGIAVVGASEQPFSLGTRFMRGLIDHEYPGQVYPVNPKYDEVMGMTAYPTVLDIPGPVDAAVLAVRAEEMENALRQCAQKGVAGAVVFAAGYKELDEAGAEAERRLAGLARELGIRFVGPNSPGFINFVDRTMMTCTSIVYRQELLRAGRLGIVAQSGGVAGIIAERAMDRAIGVSYMLCTGNEADFDTPEAIEYLVDDPLTDSIAVYVEGVGDGGRLVKAWDKAAAAGKPVVIYKPGSSGASKRAALAHTGSLAGDDAVFDGFARQYGVVRVYDLDDMLEVATALPRMPRRDFESVLILTTSGGGSVLLADEVGRQGMGLPELQQDIQDKLAEGFHRFAVLRNPVDMTSDFVQNPPLFKRSIDLVTQSSDHDVTVLVLTVQRPAFARQLSDMILASPQAKDGRLIVLWYAGDMSSGARGYLRDNGVIVFERPHSAALALAAGRIWFRRGRPVPLQTQATTAVPAAPTARQTNSAVTFDLLEQGSVPVAPYRLASGPDEVAAAASAVPGPWAVKSASGSMARKSDRGGVVLGVHDQAGLAQAYDSVVSATGNSDVLIQSMISSAFELLLSVSIDPMLGPALVFGLGGRLVELHRRVAVRRPRIEARDVERVMDELGLAEILHGFRDVPAVDPAELARVANALAEVAVGLLPSGGILEVNPLAVRADGGGLVCLDVKLALEDEAAADAARPGSGS
jgi:acyl-CoA synthetase (NDP forming)